MTRSKAILENGDAPTVAVVEAAVRVLGGECVVWEPDTFRLEFAELGIDLPDENYDALFAALTVAIAGNVFWDTLAFAQTALVFNDLPAVPHLIPQCLPEHLAWAVELMIHFAEPPAELDRDSLFDTGPQTYIAACCVDAGFIVAPQGLEFVQEEMDRLGAATDKARAKVSRAWDSLSAKSSDELLSLDFAEDGVGVHLARLAACRLYVLMQQEAQGEALKDLESEAT